MRAAGDHRLPVVLQLADDLMLASTLVRNAYWASRGEESYEL